MARYRSSIPATASERIVSRHPGSRIKQRANYFVDRKLVGIRTFHETGGIEFESPMRHGRLHGTVHRFDIRGKLDSSEPYRNGLPHGIAKQYGSDGKLLGTYAMKHGAGIDLWWDQYDEHSLPFLSEARYLKDGVRHGWEWWLDDSRKSVWSECHYFQSRKHGIEREWRNGKLRRGYPRYWLHEERVTKRRYLRAALKDPALPPFRAADNRPERTFPPEIQSALRRKH